MKNLFETFELDTEFEAGMEASLKMGFEDFEIGSFSLHNLQVDEVDFLLNTQLQNYNTNNSNIHNPIFSYEGSQATIQHQPLAVNFGYLPQPQIHQNGAVHSPNQNQWYGSQSSPQSSNSPFQEISTSPSFARNNYSPDSNYHSPPGPVTNLMYHSGWSPESMYSLYPQNFHNQSVEAFKARAQTQLKAKSSKRTPLGNADMRNSSGDVETLINKVRNVRVKLGFTQSDLATSMKKVFGRSFSQTTICRFEGKQLTNQNMKKLFPFFNKWLARCETDLDFIKNTV